MNTPTHAEQPECPPDSRREPPGGDSGVVASACVGTWQTRLESSTNGRPLAYKMPQCATSLALTCQISNQINLGRKRKPKALAVHTTTMPPLHWSLHSMVVTSIVRSRRACSASPAPRIFQHAVLYARVRTARLPHAGAKRVWVVANTLCHQRVPTVRSRDRTTKRQRWAWL